MSADVDIDVPDRSQLLSLIKHIPAQQIHQGHARQHNSGIYVTKIPVDQLNGTAAIDYLDAEARGYFKIDILNMSVYQLIKGPDHYEEMLAATPNWDRLWQDPTWSKQLVHVGNYTELLRNMKPDTIPRMAAFISIIRPGKAHLQNKPWDEVFNSVWDGDDSRGFVFKKAHAVGYSALVALHMNILEDVASQSGEPT